MQRVAWTWIFLPHPPHHGVLAFEERDRGEGIGVAVPAEAR